MCCPAVLMYHSERFYIHKILFIFSLSFLFGSIGGLLYELISQNIIIEQKVQ